MNNKAKARARAQAIAWLDTWKQAHPEQPVVRNKQVSPRGKVPIGSNKRLSVGAAIYVTWKGLSNPSPRKPGLWGWHKPEKV